MLSLPLPSTSVNFRGPLLLIYLLAVVPIITDGQPYSFLPPMDPTLPQPKILSESETFHAQIGDSVVLPCEVQDLGPMVLIWKKGTRVLTAGEMMVKRDDRMVLRGTALALSDITVEDGGEYSCEIEADSEYPIVLTHTLEVLVPPSLTATNDEVEVRSGATVALKCRTSGYPPPRLVWKKRNDRLPASSQRQDEGTTLTMTNVGRHHSGVYECEADNGVGEPVKKQISLNVLYEPEVSAEFPVVHGGIGHSAELSCLVYADPNAEVIWYRETMRLDPNGQRYMESRGSRHTLIVRKVEQQDFANYSCYAVNLLGKARAYLTLRGNPNPPVLNSHVFSKSRTSYRISWVTESYAPVEEYRLLYRKLPNESGSRKGRPTAIVSDIAHSWSNLRLPPKPAVAVDSANGLLRFEGAHTLEPLIPDSSYEAKVSAKNKYGWSQSSKPFQFYTQGQATSPNQNFVKKPEVQDMGLSSSSSSASSNSAPSSSSIAASSPPTSSSRPAVLVLFTLLAPLCLASYL